MLGGVAFFQKIAPTGWNLRISEGIQFPCYRGFYAAETEKCAGTTLGVCGNTIAKNTAF